MYYSNNNHLTSNSDIDLTILSTLNDEYILNLCHVNKYVHQLCQRSDFWINKIQQKHYDMTIVKNLKNPIWMDVYFSLVKANNNLISIYTTDTFIHFKTNLLIDSSIYNNIFEYTSQNIHIKKQISDIEIIKYITKNKINTFVYFITNNQPYILHLDNHRLYAMLFYLHYYHVIK